MASKKAKGAKAPVVEPDAPEWVDVGRKYSRRLEAAGMERFDRDRFHRFTNATRRYATWATAQLELHDVPVNELVNGARDAGELVAATGIRRYVECLPEIEPDSSAALAARILELCELVELWQATPELFRPGAGLQYVFELGRVSMLAAVYGIDDKATATRLGKMNEGRRLYSDEDKAKWCELRKTDYPAPRSALDAARQIVKKLGLPHAAIESVRREIGKKPIHK